MATYSPSKITKDGNTYNFTDATKIPLSGTSNITGMSFFKSTNDSQLQIGSGTSTINGGCLIMYGSEYSNTDVAGAFRLRAGKTSIYDLIGKVNGTLTWGTKNVAMQEDVVPRSGGAVLSGNEFLRTVDNNFLTFSGGSAWLSGGSIAMYGPNTPNRAGELQFFAVDGNTSKEMNLKPNGTWTWTGSACVVGSDRRIKDEISEISDELLDAWENLEPKQYKLKSDLENDKETAQIHYGWIAQEVESIIKGDRKGEIKNGLWLHETWEEQEEVSHEETYTEEVETKSGEKQTITKTRKVIDTPYKAKGDSYGLRYTECLVVECKYLRRCIERLTARIEELEKGNNTK